MVDSSRSMVKVAGTAVMLAGGGLVVVAPTVHANPYSATDFASLVTAMNAANTNPGPDTITIAAGTINLGSGGLPKITGDLTITGAGEALTIIDGASNYRIIYIDDVANQVTISDLTLQNGYYSSFNGGAAIYGAGTSLALSNITFAGNASAAYGGAVQWIGVADDEDLTITDCTFADNYTEQKGGALRAVPQGGTVSISGTTFSDNTANGSGSGAGAVSMYGSGTVIITDSTFTGNYAGSYGGAIYLIGAELEVTIDGSTFEENASGAGAGAIEAVKLGSLAISDTGFTNNSALGAAGALFLNDVYGGTTITGSTFYSNYAAGSGGAIYAVGSNNGYATLTIDDTEFTMNRSMGYGGAIEAYELDQLTIANSSFDDNAAYRAGGAIYGENVYEGIVISGSTFDGNTARGSGALRSGDDLTITGSAFTGNLALGGEGGAIYAVGYAATVTIDDSMFTDNYSVTDGGAILAYTLGSLTITNSTFTGNVAYGDGGAIYADAVYDGVEVSGSTFADNSAGYDGGAIYAGTAVVMSILDSTFDGNSAASDGGALAVLGSLLILDSTFSENSSGYDGGAVALYAVDGATIVQSTFAGNAAGRYGGALYVGDASSVAIVNSTIANNSADSAGGGIFVSGLLGLYNTIVSDNTADGSDDDIDGILVPDVGSGIEVTGGNNLVEVSNVTLAGEGNIEGESANLGALGDNGGTTETMVPNAGSPAIDAGDDDIEHSELDQRGATRVQGDAIDIGAVETTPTTPTPPTPPILPATGAGAERLAWWAVALSGLGGLSTLAARRRPAGLRTKTGSR